MTNPYDDPHYEPPSDIEGAEARAYESKIVSLLQQALIPGTGALRVESIELRGERPNTEIIFRYTDATRHNQQPKAVGIALWKSEYPTSGASGSGTLQEPASVAGWIYSAWTADELDPVDLR